LGLGAAVLSNVSLAYSGHAPQEMVHAQTNATSSARIDIDSGSRTFTDASGRQVLFHGVNVVYKVDPYIPSNGEFDSQNSLNDEDIVSLKTWGMNFVRLGVMWEAVERTAGTYDDAYLDKVEVLINKLGEAGIYTLVDAHQDVFARSICGEGMPDFYARELLDEDSHCMNGFLDKLLQPLYNKFGVCWDLESAGFRKDDNGDPYIEDCQTRDFYTYYLTKQSISAFGNFFENKNGMQDKFVDYWDHVSARFANNPYVVGYDPLNEPFPANPARDPLLFTPGHMDQKYLAPLYEQVYEKYQSHDANQQMWFEPVPFPDEAGILSGYVFPVGFQSPPGGDMGSNKHVLNDHTYCCQLSSNECKTGEPQVEHADKCLKWHEKRIGQRAKDAERLGVPLVITEFGACLTEGPCSQEINQVGDTADDNLVGWAYWQFKTYADLTTSAGTGSEGFWNQDGTLQDYKVKALARSYLPLTQGRLSSMKFDTNTALLKAVFTFSEAAGSSETSVYLNKEYWYPSGYDVYVANGDATPVRVSSKKVDGNYYNLNVAELVGAKEGDQISIKVYAKQVVEEIAQ
jgi:endoglycosylceramidase